MTNDTFQLEDLPQPAEETTVPTDRLETDGDNPNEMSDEQFGLLKDRMRKHGWLGGEILCDTDYVIADGEHRWRAAQEIGLSEVPIKAYDIDDATRRLWRLEMNKNQGEHDTKRDALEYDYLLDNGKSEEVTELVDAAGEDLDELLKEIRVDVSSPVGYDYDVDHNVYFEDCVEGMQERISDESIDTVVTDPPYGVDWDTNSREKEKEFATIKNDQSVDDAIKLWQDVAVELKRVLKEDGHIYVFADWRTEHEFRTVLEDIGFAIQNVLIWDKEQMGLGGTVPINYRTQYELVIFATLDSPRHLSSRGGDVFQHPREHGENLTHPTQKPTGLISTYITNSTDEEDTILDPFMGSGTTAVAAIQNDRNYVGFELDEDNYKPVIERRIKEATRAKDASVNQAEADD